MDITPDGIKAWLSKNGKNRVWLAEQCSVSKTTVDGWLSTGRPIPGSSRKIIERLMSGVPALEPKLTLAEFEKAQQIASAEGKTVTQWFEGLIKSAIKLIILLSFIAKLASGPTDWSAEALFASVGTGVSWFATGAGYVLGFAWQAGSAILAAI